MVRNVLPLFSLFVDNSQNLLLMAEWNCFIAFEDPTEQIMHIYKLSHFSYVCKTE